MRRLFAAAFAAVLVAGLVPCRSPRTDPSLAAPASAAAQARRSGHRSGPKYKVLVLVVGGLQQGAEDRGAAASTAGPGPRLHLEVDR